MIERGRSARNDEQLQFTSFDEARSVLIAIPRTFRQFRIDVKTNNLLMYQSLENTLGPEWHHYLPQYMARNGRVTYELPSPVQAALLQDMKVPFTVEIPYLQREGWMTIQELMTSLDLSESTVRFYADQIQASWQNDSMRIPIGKRRVFLLPPNLTSSIKEYSKFTDEREHLTRWRNVLQMEQTPFSVPKSTNDNELTILGLSFQRHLRDKSLTVDTDLYHSSPPLGEVKESLRTRSSKRGKIASTILENKDLLMIHPDEEVWLEDFRHEGLRSFAELFLSYMHRVHLVAETFYHIHVYYSRLRDRISVQDLQSEAAQLLISALDEYDPDDETKVTLERTIFDSIQEGLERYADERSRKR